MAATTSARRVTKSSLMRITGLPEPTVRTILRQAVRDGATKKKTGRVVMFRWDEVKAYFDLEDSDWPGASGGTA